MNRTAITECHLHEAKLRGIAPDRIVFAWSIGFTRSFGATSTGGYDYWLIYLQRARNG